MSKTYWLTPEEVLVKKKRKKRLMYSSIMIGAILISALVTILANNIS
ncbi:hypothetical protein ABES03_25200 [Neobacillus rhizosphaerae]